MTRSVEAIHTGAPAPACRPVLEEIDRAGIEYCLLRGDPETGEGIEDVDLLVRPADSRRLRDLLLESGFVARRGPAAPYKTVFVRYRAGRFVCLDIHEEIVQNGLVYMDRDRALARRVRRAGTYVLSDEDLLLHLVWHNLLRRPTTRPAVRDQIRRLLDARLDRDYLRAHSAAFGLAGAFPRAARLLAGEAEEREERRRLRREFWWAVCRSRRGNWRTSLRFRMSRWGARRRRGGLIALVGPDGSGKSTVVAAIRRRASAIHGLKVETVYLGPWGQLELPWVKMLRRAGMTPSLEPWGLRLADRLRPGRTSSGARRPAAWSLPLVLSKWVRSLFKGWLFYSALYAELLYRYARGILPRTRRGCWVVSDRYPTDLRYLYKGQPIRSYPVLRFLVCRLFPRPDLFVLLDNLPAVTHSRKPDLSEEQIDTCRRLYLKALAGAPYEVLTTERRPEEIADDILERIVRLSGAR